MANPKLKFLRGNGVPPTLEAGQPAYDLQNEILYIGDGTNKDKIGGKGAVVMLDGNQTVGGEKTFSETITGSISGNAGTATILATSRDISLSGDVSGSASFNGSANASISATLANSGVSAGTYTKLTVDAKGRATAGTTLEASDIPSLTSDKISDFDSQVRTSRLDQMAAPTSIVSLNSQKLTSVADPTIATDAANKGYVDSAASDLQDAIDAEASTRSSAVSSLESSLSNETSARVSAVNALQESLTTEISDRTAGDVALGGRIDDEIAARESAVTTLTTRIANVESNTSPEALDSLTEVVEAFQAADNNLNGAITSLASTASSGLAAETSAREAADEDLQDAIDAEVSARQSAVSAVSASLATEVSNLTNAINNETIARETAISDETMARQAGDDALANSLSVESGERQAADTALDGRVSSLESSVSGLGSLSTQNANNVAITGGSISGVTFSDIVLDGGTY